jgi:hypothetical protein
MATGPVRRTLGLLLGLPGGHGCTTQMPHMEHMLEWTWRPGGTHLLSLGTRTNGVWERRVMCCNYRTSGHRTTLAGTPLRSCLTSPPSMPPMKRRPGLSLSPAAGKRTPAAAARRHPALWSKAPRRMRRAARKSKSGTLSGLQPWPPTDHYE